MKKMPIQMKISYALVFFPIVILILWCIYAAIFGYSYDFITSLGNDDLYYGFEGVEEALDAFMICLLFKPNMWISAIIWLFSIFHFAARSIALIYTRNFDMSTCAQNIFTVAVVIMNIGFLFGISIVL